MSHDQHESVCEKFSRELRHFKWREIFTWKLLKTLAMGQGLSALICGTAVTSQYLATEFHLDVPMFQGWINYILLCLTYTIALCFRKGDENIMQILRTKWWKYLLLGLADVEANYAVVKAYQYTTLTSIQLLDCFILPVLLILSRVFLKTRYRIVHYVAVCVCLAGVGAMVGADIVAGRDQGSIHRHTPSYIILTLTGSNILLGDGLVIISATLYAVSNLCQEYIVKNKSRLEFLGMVGLFGTLISGIQLCMPVVINMTSATAVNLSLLTADLFSLFCGLFLFQYIFSGLYVVSLVVIMVGFIMFNAVPTPNQAPEAVTEEGGHDNEVENQVEGENVSSGKSIPAENEHGFVLSSVKM
ncbi:solute carrier family 35 member F2 isoform X4 [Ictalurus punctatus]|uniref:Solute carrier family 35 member F2 isoform X4 n=1 Tax=Ictalurus punctatus TaxID=7998 RepID=A0A9F7RJI7_ICTPU|nr:solute carrier family 35 member F2 isoform X4 [Ictalurus punctatus]